VGGEAGADRRARGGSERGREGTRGVAGIRGEVGRGAAHAEGGRGKEELGRARRRFGLRSFIPSPFLFFFYTLTIQTIPFEFK
jgi:hypothetical protein